MMRNKPVRPFTADDIATIDLYDTEGNVLKNITISKSALDTKIIFSEGEAFVLDAETSRYVAVPYFIHVDPTL